MQIAPYISDRKKKRKRIRAYLFTVLGLAILYVIFFLAQWTILRSPLFRVDSVVVQGNSAVTTAQAIALAQAAAAPRSHFFTATLTFDNMMLWPSVIPQQDLAMVPQLATETVSKDYFSHTVTITVTERSPFGIWCFSAPPNGSAMATSSAAISASAPCYWFDDTGTIYQKAGETQGDLVFVVYDSAQASRGLDQKVLPDDFLPNLISIMNVLKASGLAVRAIEVNNLSLEEVDVLTGNGPTVYFSLQFPADEYLPVIQKLMTQPNFDDLQYVDCRTQNRLYYE